MKLNRVKLKGFIGLHKNMGVDTVDLDLSGLTGLVALEGENGMGKTTLLENLQPFRTLPSRKSTLKTHCFLKNSFKELWFDFGGDAYHTLVKMDPTTTVSDEGFIWKNNEPQVNGKVSEFDKYLNKLLGSPSLYFNSIFCAQNSQKLSDLRPSELKQLFAEFLRLDRYVEYEKTAKAAIVAYDNGAMDLVNIVKRLKDRRGLMGNVKSDFENAEKVLAYLETKQTESKFRIDDAHNLETKCKVAAAAQVENNAALAAANKERETMKALAIKHAEEFEGFQTDIQTRSATLQDEARQVEIDLEDADKVNAAAKIHDQAERALDDLELRNDVFDIEITDVKELLGNETDRLKIVNDQIEGIGKDTMVIDATDKINEFETRIGKILLQIENIHRVPELILLVAELDSLKKSAAVLDGIDPACTSEVCGLITQSLEDKKAVPGAIVKINETEVRLIRAFNKEIEEYRVEIADLTVKIEAHVKERNALLADYRKTQGEIEACIKLLEVDILNRGRKQGAVLKDIVDWKKTKADAKSSKDRLPAILIAQARKVDINKQLDDLTKQTDTLEKKYTAEGIELTQKLLENSKEVDRLAFLVDPYAGINLKNAEDGVKIARQEGVKIFEDIVKCQADLEKRVEAIREAASIDGMVKTTEAVIAKFRDQEGQWAYLADACSKNGLRALEIEGVAPVITAHANDMLTGTFGPNHAVRFETQDEDGKEVLDIVVISEDGSETLLSNLSGGERVWILKALSLAQTLISQEKSGRHFETALMDEEDGALSNANAMKFIALYRTLMNIAKMGACVFISHRPEAIALADHRIKLEKGGISVI